MKVNSKRNQDKITYKTIFSYQNPQISRDIQPYVVQEQDLGQKTINCNKTQQDKLHKAGNQQPREQYKFKNMDLHQLYQNVDNYKKIRKSISDSNLTKNISNDIKNLLYYHKVNQNFNKNALYRQKIHSFLRNNEKQFWKSQKKLPQLNYEAMHRVGQQDKNNQNNPCTKAKHQQGECITLKKLRKQEQRNLREKCLQAKMKQLIEKTKAINFDSRRNIFIIFQ